MSRAAGGRTNPEVPMTSPIRATTERDGRLERIVLDQPKANILDLAMIGAIRAHLRRLAEEPGARRVLVFEGAGAHFSFGASVAEHLPERVPEMLPAFGALFRELEALAIPTAAVVRGQCLGGGFELALFCGRVFCDPTAHFGAPEIKLGVFPPLAALALRWRLPGAVATRLILSGEIISGEEAAQMGLADRCTEDPEAALAEWFEADLADKSAVALRMAWRAVRRPLARSLQSDLPELERLYLEDLMSHADPKEGIRAFLERRPAVWSHT
jgi:cyclohexa-1,5-dienecarbonyl-CoA hydratase